jgi:hypothetical protein
MSLSTRFHKISLRLRLTTLKGFYAVRKDISLWKNHEERIGYGDCHVYTQVILEEIGQLPKLYPILNIALFGIIPQYNRLNFPNEQEQLPIG